MDTRNEIYGKNKLYNLCSRVWICIDIVFHQSHDDVQYND